jgi:TonB-linked SusC/RagA family outer membrane protein
MKKKLVVQGNFFSCAKKVMLTAQIIAILLLTGMSSLTAGENLELKEPPSKDSFSLTEDSEQQKTISGTVLDESGQAMPGVTVVIKGTTSGAVTNMDGIYSIANVPENSTLVFSFVGMTTQEIVVGKQVAINVSMKADAIGIEEVVAIGYGTVKKSDLTGAVAVVSGDDLTSMASPNFEQGMQGKVAGLQMTQTSAEPGGGISVKIRGTNSLLGSSEPLYVIDGFPISNDNASRPGGWEGQGSLNLLSNLNPSDIESVQVLKDASATAIYGSRGANGVVIVTTKKGKTGEGSMSIDYSHSFSMAKAPVEFANVYDYTRIENERLFNNNAQASEYRYTREPNAYWPEGNVSPEQLGEMYGDGTNWVEEVIQPGKTNNVNLSFTGGTEKTTYHISANYYDEQGVVINSDYMKASVRANIASQINKVVRVEASMSGSRYESERYSQTGRILGGGPDRLGTITAAFRANPMATTETNPLEHNNLLQYQPGTNGVANFVYNPVMELNDADNSDAMNFFMGTMKIDFDILDGLKMTFNGGANIQSQERVNFMPFTTHVGAWYGGIGSHSFFDKRDFLFENYLNYNKTFDEVHKINATLGYSLQSETSQSKALNGSGYNFDIQGIYGWGQQASPGPPDVVEYGKQTASVYGRLFYNYKDRLMVTLSARQDGASVFAANKKWAFFPSVAVAYVMSEESFLEDATWLSNLKLRASYGIVGNQAIAPYRSLATLAAQGYVLGGSKTSGLSPATPANPDLIWESTKQLDIGADASFLDNRIKFGVDYYQKNTVDLLQNKQVPGITGYSTFTTNFGEISNKGIELMLGGTISTKALGWESNLTWSVNKSKIENLGIGADGTPILTALTPSPGIADGLSAHRFVVGEPVGTFYGYTIDGMLQQEDIDAGYPTFGGLNTIGELKVVDINDDGVINDTDMSAIGNAQPDFIFGWDNTFTYKNWSLNAFVNGSVGGEVFNMMKIYTSMGGGGGRPSQDYVNDYWTPENTDAEFPKPGGGLETINTFLLESASFVRLQSLAINYQLPLDKMNINWMRNATIYARGTNLFVLTNYTGFDPETGFSGQKSWAPNIDLGNYPRPKTIQLGVKVTF